MGFVHCLEFQKARSNATFWELYFSMHWWKEVGGVPVEFGPLERATGSSWLYTISGYMICKKLKGTMFLEKFLDNIYNLTV